MCVYIYIYIYMYGQAKGPPVAGPAGPPGCYIIQYDIADDLLYQTIICYISLLYIILDCHKRCQTTSSCRDRVLGPPPRKKLLKADPI